MKRFLAVVDFLLRAHLRGPIMLLAVGLFALLFESAPAVGAPGSVSRVRTAAESALGLGFLLLAVTALVLPLTSLWWTGPTRLGAALGRRPVQAGSLVGHALFLLLLAGVLGALGYVLVRLRHEDASAPVVRRVLARMPEGTVRLDARHPRHELRIPAGSLEAGRGVYRLRFRARARITARRPGSLPGLSYPLKVAYRVAGDPVWIELPRLTVRRAREETLDLHPDPEAAVRGLEIRFSRPAPGYELIFPRGSMRLLGGPAGMLASMLRGFMAQGLGALSLLAVVLWLSRFTAYPIAVCGAVVTAAASAMLFPRVLPGAPWPDPGGLLLGGMSVAWGDLGPAALKAAGAGAVAVLLAVHDRRLERPV